jgi:hypothetical protein
MPFVFMGTGERSTEGDRRRMIVLFRLSTTHDSPGPAPRRRISGRDLGLLVGIGLVMGLIIYQRLTGADVAPLIVTTGGLLP